MRLADLAGLTVEEFAEAFLSVNLLDAFPGKQGKGDKFPLEEAIKAARVVEERFAHVPLFIMAGKNVARAFSMDTDFFLWQMRGARLYVCIPHPSKVSRWWNDGENVAYLAGFLRGVLPYTGYRGT